MKNCESCGLEISEEQFDKFEAMCSECIRAKKYGTSTEKKAKIEKCYYCDRAATNQCQDCRKPICGWHQQQRESNFTRNSIFSSVGTRCPDCDDNYTGRACCITVIFIIIGLIFSIVTGINVF